MSFNEQIAAEIVRKRLNLSSAIDVLWAIPESLERLSRKIAANPRKRNLLLTSTADEALLADSSVQLSSVVGAPLPEYLHHGQIWYKNRDAEVYPYPLQRLDNAAFTYAPKTFGNDYYHYHLDGDYLRVRNFDINQPDSVEGSLLFAVPRRAEMADLAARKELQELFIEKLVETLTGPTNDAAEDGEN